MSNDESRLERLVRTADRASARTRFGPYPMAPCVGLSEAEHDRHRSAMEACGVAAKGLRAAGDARAGLYEKAVENHSWVVQRRGAF